MRESEPQQSQHGPPRGSAPGEAGQGDEHQAEQEISRPPCHPMPKNQQRQNGGGNQETPEAGRAKPPVGAPFRSGTRLWRFHGWQTSFMARRRASGRRPGRAQPAHRTGRGWGGEHARPLPRGDNRCPWHGERRAVSKTGQPDRGRCVAGKFIARSGPPLFVGLRLPNVGEWRLPAARESAPRRSRGVGKRRRRKCASDPRPNTPTDRARGSRRNAMISGLAEGKRRPICPSRTSPGRGAGASRPTASAVVN